MPEVILNLLKVHKFKFNLNLLYSKSLENLSHKYAIICLRGRFTNIDSGICSGCQLSI